MFIGVDLKDNEQLFTRCDKRGKCEFLDRSLGIIRRNQNRLLNSPAE